MTFKSGKSGNPRGKRPGTKNKRLALLQSNDVRLQKKVLSMALAGDISAMKIIADRLWPRLRAQAPLISIDTASNDIAEQGRQIIDSALSGNITVDAGRDLLTALYAQGKIVELAEFEDRIKALENHQTLPPWKTESSKRELRLITDQELLPMRGKRRRLTK